MKIIITGASGFIGTNLLQFYIDKGVDVINIDICQPRKNSHMKYWKKLDILNKVLLESVVLAYEPDYVIHLAARTDLNGKEIRDYRINYKGVENVLEVLKKAHSVKRAIFASSMLVCKVGYKPSGFNDYSPTTIYGQSKVLAEAVIKNVGKINYTIVIVRPTSIWGPWFGPPYLNFFKLVRRGLFFKFGKSLATKTFGFVGNTVLQIDALLFCKKDLLIPEVFYLGDNPPLNIGDWADLITDNLGLKKSPSLPMFLMKILTIFGDILEKFGLTFPVTSFRLLNLTTGNVINLSYIYNILEKNAYKTEQGITLTINWLEEINER
jgi:GlcNAc-P-P-Und epimerase